MWNKAIATKRNSQVALKFRISVTGEAFQEARNNLKQFLHFTSINAHQEWGKKDSLVKESRHFPKL